MELCAEGGAWERGWTEGYAGTCMYQVTVEAKIISPFTCKSPSDACTCIIIFQKRAW